MAAKKSVSKELVKPSPSQSALSVWGNQVEKYKNREKLGGVQKISTQGRLFSVGGKKIGDGKKIYAIILEFTNVKRWYRGVYNPDVITPPDCFAIAVGDDLAPHENSADPQAATCDKCEKNQFGSVEGRSGKACADVRRLVLLTGDTLVGKTVATAENTTLNILEIPPTGLSNWRSFYRYADGQGLPPRAFVVAIEFDETQTREIVKFTPISIIENIEFIKYMESLSEEAERVGLRPWNRVEVEEVAKTTSKKTVKSSDAKQDAAKTTVKTSLPKPKKYQ